MIPDAPEHTRGFYDPEKLRHLVTETAKVSYQEALNKIETENFKLRVKDIAFDKTKLHYTYKDQKEAVLKREDLVSPLRGTFELIDKRTGKVVDEKKTIIASIPYITDRNTTVLNGSEYIVINQQRLKPGVYTRIKESGEAEAHVNVKSGTGFGGKIIFYPEKALFVYNVGTTQIKLYGLMKDLGVPDSSMEAAWGKEIFDKNKAHYEGTEIDKLYSKIFMYDK